MRLAVIADTHIPDCTGSAEEASLTWALQACRARQVTAVAFAGDLTATGAPAEIERFRRILAGFDLPLIMTPGNSDLRTPENLDAARRAFSQPDTLLTHHVGIVALDTAEGCIPPPEFHRFLQRLQTAASKERSLFVLTHWSPVELPEEDQHRLAAACSTFGVAAIVGGHKHLDAKLDLEGIPVHLVRGLDPEKAKAAPPALTLFDGLEDTWSRHEVPWNESDPRTWTEEERRDFLSRLGISTMTRTLADTRAATDAAVPVLELRAEPALAESRVELRRAVASWRNAGGRILSLHLPNVTWETATGAVGGIPLLRQAVQLAMELNVDQITIHVPRASVADMEPGGRIEQAMLHTYAGELQPLADAGIVIGIENLHRNRGEAVDEQRGFGYTPPECLSWCEQIQACICSGDVGMVLDIGHARNNAPFSQRWTLGRWLAETGPRAVGYHLHQVSAAGNHQPLTAPFGPSISLAALFWAWRSGHTAKAPLFLEIRPESAMLSHAALTHELSGLP